MTDAQDPPKAIDWEYIKALYFQGVGPAEIARKTGIKACAISVKATRNGWTSLLRKTGGPRQETTLTVTENQEDSSESNQLTQASAKARAALSDEVLRAVATLTDTKPAKALRTQAARAGVIQTLASAAKTTFGWSDSSSQPSVRINVLSSFSVAPPEPAKEEKPVIDVTPVPALPPPEPV
jgi:hypothetical protein